MIKHWMLLFFFNILLFSPLDGKDRRPSYPFITGDGFRALADHILDEDTWQIDLAGFKQGDIVFVKTEFLQTFIDNTLDLIPYPFILLTHNSDIDIPGPWQSVLDHKKLLAWFGQNVIDNTHPKIHPIPIGITNRYNFNGDISVYLHALKKAQLALGCPRKLLLYWNMNIATSPCERQKSFNYFSQLDYCVTLPNLVPFKNYVRNLLKTHFIVSPRGNGLDCHRTWEALYFGAIPIVKRSGLDSALEDLPVLFVNDWNEVTKELLENYLESLPNKKLNQEKLWFPYWENLITNFKNI
jgi:hypothetical protein